MRHTVLLLSFLITILGTLTACDGGDYSAPAARVLVLSESQSPASGMQSAGNTQQDVLQATYTNDTASVYRLRVDVQDAKAYPLVNSFGSTVKIEHSIIRLSLLANGIEVDGKIVMVLKETEQDATFIVDYNVSPGVKIDVKVTPVLIVSGGIASISWASMTLQLLQGD